MVFAFFGTEKVTLQPNATPVKEVAKSYGRLLSLLCSPLYSPETFLRFLSEA